jgi:hypothetical protein
LDAIREKHTIAVSYQQPKPPCPRTRAASSRGIRAAKGINHQIHPITRQRLETLDETLVVVTNRRRALNKTLYHQTACPRPATMVLSILFEAPTPFKSS